MMHRARLRANFSRTGPHGRGVSNIAPGPLFGGIQASWWSQATRQKCQKWTLTLPEEVEHWSVTTLPEKLVKIGARVVRHCRYVTFHLAEVAVPRELFRNILSLIDDLRPRPAPTQAKGIDGEAKTTGRVCPNGNKVGRMGFWTPPADENRAIRKIEAKTLPTMAQFG